MKREEVSWYDRLVPRGSDWNHDQVDYYNLTKYEKMINNEWSKVQEYQGEGKLCLQSRVAAIHFVESRQMYSVGLTKAMITLLIEETCIMAW